MPAPSYSLATSLPPLHLYRHILREASYLPPAFRATIESTIQDRFHRNREDGVHSKKRLSRASGVLRTLRAANSGDKAAMEGLIMKGFGRTGNRRRELMAELVKSQGPNDSQALEALLNQTRGRDDTLTGSKADLSASQKDQQSSPKIGKRRSKNAFFEKWDQPKLLQILQSQKHQQKETKGTASWPGTSIKGTDPDQFVPEKNIWGNRPAESLVRTKRAHWWRRNADKIMPPLGKGEWELLQRLADGAQESGEWAIPRRRPHAVTKPPSDPEIEGERHWDWTPHATEPTARTERRKTLSQQRKTGEHDSGPYGGRQRSNDVSSRWFRRVYNRTWQLTPSMEQDPNTLQYSFAWGKATSKLPTPTASQMEVFDGVDRRGNKVNKKP